MVGGELGLDRIGGDTHAEADLEHRPAEARRMTPELRNVAALELVHDRLVLDRQVVEPAHGVVLVRGLGIAPQRAQVLAVADVVATAEVELLRILEVQRLHRVVDEGVADLGPHQVRLDRGVEHLQRRHVAEQERGRADVQELEAPRSDSHALHRLRRLVDRHPRLEGLCDPPGRAQILALFDGLALDGRVRRHALAGVHVAAAEHVELPADLLGEREQVDRLAPRTRPQHPREADDEPDQPRLMQLTGLEVVRLAIVLDDDLRVDLPVA